MNLLEKVASTLPPEIEVPPKVFIDMGAEIVDFEEGHSLCVRFPVRERYQNPFGFMQGGMVAAAIDNTIGPLSMLVASPSVTTQLNTTFIRPIGQTEEFIEITAQVVEITRRHLHIQADVRNAAGKLCVKGMASCSIINGGDPC